MIERVLAFFGLLEEEFRNLLVGLIALFLFGFLDLKKTEEFDISFAVVFGRSLVLFVLVELF